jgi:hypothetical protein
MMSRVTRRAQRHADRAGDPLDGLVNMFDLGIVLAVGFLVAGIGLSQLVRKHGSATQGAGLVVNKNQQAVPLRRGQHHVAIPSSAKSVGKVYRLANGQLVYVTKR